MQTLDNQIQTIGSAITAITCNKLEFLGKDIFTDVAVKQLLHLFTDVTAKR